MVKPATNRGFDRKNSVRDPALDDDLLQALEEAARSERSASVAVIECLVKVIEANVALRKGYPSAFELLVERLKYTERAAYKRIYAARAVLVRPEVMDDLKEGRLTVSGLAVISRFLERPGADAVLAQARGMSSREIERLVAGLDPHAEVGDRIRTLRVLPNGEERVQFTFTGSSELRRKVERARAVMSNAIPGAKLEQIFLAAVDEYLERNDAERRIARKKARLERRQSAAAAAMAEKSAAVEDRTRRIPENVKQEVYSRDGGSCSYVGDGGRRCGSTHQLEYDHIFPFALGGPSDVAMNIRLLCRAHNQFVAQVAFGDAVVGKLAAPPIPP